MADTNATVSIEDILLANCYPALMIDKIVTPLWYVIGLTGNVISGYIWLQTRMRGSSSSAIYLLALSVSDSAFLLLHPWQELSGTWGWNTVNHRGVCEAFACAFMVSQYLATVLVLGFTVDRFIAVRYPFKKVSGPPS